MLRKGPTCAKNKRKVMKLFNCFRMESKLAELNAAMTDHPDFPKPGVLFKNIMPLFNSPRLLTLLGDVLEEAIKTNYPDCTKLVGLESRGFLMGMG